MIINAIAIANGGTTRPPVLEELNVTDNGTFTPSTGVDGFNPVNVDVQPNLQTKSVKITTNGQSTVVADSSFDGMESLDINVNVPIPTFTTEEKNITANGTYTPSTDGYSKVTVNVEPNLQTKSVEINSNGQSTVVADSSFDGLDSVNLNINVPIPTFTTEELTATRNGTYTPSTDGYSKVTVNVQPKLQAKTTTTTITSNGTSTISVTPDSNFDGLSSASVTITTNVESSGGGSSTPTIYITNGTKLCLPNNNGEVSDLSGMSTIGLTTMDSMFENSTTTGILIDGWNVSGVTSIANLLNNCSSVTSLAMKNMNFSDTLTTDNAFDGASSIETLDFSGSNATFLNTIETSIMPMALAFRGSTFNSYPSFEFLYASDSTIDIRDCDMSNITSNNSKHNFITNFANIIVNENTVLPNCDLDMRYNHNWFDSEEDIIKFFDRLIPNAGHTVTYYNKMGVIKSDWATDNVLAFIQSKGWSVVGAGDA